MTVIDWVIVAAYFLGMIGLSIYVGRHLTDEEDYYLAGRNLPWWAVGISTMATQTSAISFISKPAFVALKPGGGLTWLQFELAVPLGILMVMLFLVPFFRKLRLVSVYEYLELRFDASVRYLVSAIFLISRALAAGVVIYATAIVLSVVLGIPLWLTILVIGIVTIIYDTIGGMSAVVYSDVIQMSILLIGIITCIMFAVENVGGFSEIFSALPPERLKAIDLSSGFGDDSQAPFWSILIGGFFLYISYYGTDQSQVQRELSSASIEDSKRSLFMNGLLRFPLTALYMIMGIAVGAVYSRSPELQAAIPRDNPDYLIPQFILLNIPVGLRSLLFAAILAAAMSSLDSTLNSLSASTMRDFIDRIKPSSGRRQLLFSKLVTVAWGLFITAFAFLAGNISGTVVEAINKIGSAFYGPILAAFLVGVLSQKANTRGIFTGILGGVVLNLLLWWLYPGIYWMWWNMFGFVFTVVLTFLVSRLQELPDVARIKQYSLTGRNIFVEEQGWLPYYAFLVIYFLVLLLLLAML